MTSYNRDGKVGPWALEKLACLGKYLDAYTTILRKKDWCKGFYYFDSFAGAGKSEIRKTSSLASERFTFDIASFHTDDAEEESYVDGSPRVALDIQHPFTKYFFIEKNRNRVRRLEELKQEYKGKRVIEVTADDASRALSNFVTECGINWKNHRAVAFLDPFGMQVPWRTLEILASTGAVEIILNFPVGMAIQRQLPRSGTFTAEQREMLTRYFGSPDWEDLLYEKTTDLFGDVDVNKTQRSGDRLARWYGKRLKSLFGYASQPYLITNSRGSHIYYLLFAGPNSTGAKIASDIFLKQGRKIS